MEAPDKNKQTCTCGNGDYLVFTCSGAADVGYLSDQAARKLSRHQVRKMNCLAMVATGNSEYLEKLDHSNNLVIDGCSEDCGLKIFQQAGKTVHAHVRVTDLGYEKGKAATSQEEVSRIYDHISSLN